MLGSCSALLGWDEQTYMPRGGAEHRGEQLALLAGMVHERATDPILADRLASVESSEMISDPISVVAVNVREWRRAYNRATRLPRELVEELAKVTSLAQGIWVEAKALDDFPRFRPWLETIVGLKRREAECLGPSETPYDALLDEYEPGATSRELAALFASLKSELTPLVQSFAEVSKSVDTSMLKRDFPVDRQRYFGEFLASAVGFDFHRGRLDTTAHPFCSGIGPGDTRITTRFRPSSFPDAFFGILHEVGHALYDQGLDSQHYGTPMGEAVSLGIHESQSRLWENFVGRSMAFWQYAFPLARRAFPETLQGVGLEAFHRAVNHVEPSLIRVEADEATYNLHILIRFEIEHAMLQGDLAVADIPGAWNEAYRQTLGITPKTDAEGCLQDIHWSAGLIGYFPTYTLGNLYAAQFHDQADQELGGLAPLFAKGDFTPLLDWLRMKIHSQGQRYHSTDLVRNITGQSPTHKPLVEALKAKRRELETA